MTKRTKIAAAISWILVLSLVLSSGLGAYAGNPVAPVIEVSAEARENAEKPLIISEEPEEELDEDLAKDEEDRFSLYNLSKDAVLIDFRNFEWIEQIFDKEQKDAEPDRNTDNKGEDTHGTSAVSKFSAVKSGMARSLPTLSIDNVEVINGGEFRYGISENGLSREGAPGAYTYFTDRRNISFTDPRRFYVSAVFTPVGSMNPEAPGFLDSVKWQLGGKALNQWYGGDNLTTTSNQFIQHTAHAVYNNNDGTYTYTAVITAQSPYANLTNAMNRPYTPYIGVTKPGFGNNTPNNVVGSYNLVATFDDSTEVLELGRTPIRVTMYDSFHTYDEGVQYIQNLKALSEANSGIINGRHVMVESIGKSFEGRDIWSVVVSDSKSSVDYYLNETRPKMLSNPVGLLGDLKAGKDLKIPLYISNIHPDEVVGVDAVMTLIEQYIYENDIEFDIATDVSVIRGTPNAQGLIASSSGWGYEMKNSDAFDTIHYTVDELLDKFILVFCLTLNPDGRAGLNRGTSLGFDLNRDAAYQTQVESQAGAKNMNRWEPLSIIEFHGHYRQLAIEPCTPPHDPNYEYDLYAGPMLMQGEAIGRAMIGNSPYNRYSIPARDADTGWDDGAPLYTPAYAMMLGVMAYTLEIPDSNQDSHDACVRAFQALAYNSLYNFEELYANKLEYKRRELLNLDLAELVDKYFVDPSNRDPVTGGPTIVGRDRQGRDNYFPECIILPVDNVNQRNMYGVYKMLEMLGRNGIDVKRSTQIVEHDGKLYPVGTYIIDFYQTNRGLANSLLGEGYDVSVYASTYNDTTINFPDSRGFTAISVFEKDVFKGKTVEVSSVTAPVSDIAGSSEYIIIKNSGIDSIRLINGLLNADKPAYMVTGYVPGAVRGDYIVRRTDFDATKVGKIIEGKPVAGEGLPTGTTILVKPRINVLADSDVYASRYMLGTVMGFDIAAFNSSNASVLTNDVNFIYSSYINPAQNVADTIRDRKIPYMGDSSGGMNFLRNRLNVPIEYTNQRTSTHEGLFKADYSASSILTSGYDTARAFQMKYGAYLTHVPDGAKVLATISDEDDYYITGWFPSKVDIKGRAVIASAFVDSTDGTAKIPVTVIPSWVVNKAHYEFFYNFIATFIFASVAGIYDDPVPVATASERTLVGGGGVDLKFIADETVGSEATLTKQLYKVTTSEIEPAYSTSGTEWIEYTGTIAINDGADYYIHWYADNSLGESNQGTFGPYQANVVLNAVPSAFVTKLNGNRNNLTITVTETFINGKTNKITETISINNNAAGTYSVGSYRVYVDTKGNDQIRSIYIEK